MSEKSLRLRRHKIPWPLWLVAGLVILTVVLSVGLNSIRKPSAQASGRLLSLPSSQGNFSRAEGPRKLFFPLDMGAHPDFQTEWWYYTGNLSTQSGRQFGFELTFFRRALAAPGDLAVRSSDLAASQAYLAHFTLTDASAGQFHAFEQSERGAAGLAGAQADPYQVWLHDWSVSLVTPGEYQLKAAQDGYQVDLRLKDLKGPILEGDRGLSQKGPDKGNASYYYSQTRLQSTGTIRVGSQSYTVNGLSWMDHEFSTSALGPNQVGWDWFSIQLDDGSELMLYHIRQRDGSLDPFSSGTIIRPDGSTRPLNVADFNIQVNHTWKSPHSSGIYPAAWTVTIPSDHLILQIKPLIADQELNLSFIYWEGAVEIMGERNGVEMTGKGYVELTGYAQSLAGKF